MDFILPGKQTFLGLGLTLALLSGSAQSLAHQRRMNAQDIAEWRMHYLTELSADGRWLVSRVTRLNPPAASEGPGDATVLIKSIEDGSERRYTAGRAAAGGGIFALSASGRWLGYRTVAQATAAQLAGSDLVEDGSGKVLGRAFQGSADVVLVDLRQGGTHTYRGIADFQFVGNAPAFLLLKRPAIGAGRAPSGPAMVDLELVPCAGGRSVTLRGVEEFAVDPTGTRIAWSSAAGLQLTELATATSRVLASTEANYRRLTWSGPGNAFAAWAGDARALALVVVTGCGADPKASLFIAASLAGFPEDCEATSTNPIWRDDEQGLFFQIQKPRPAVPSRPTTPGIVLWHSRDEELPAAKMAGMVTKYWSYLSLSDRRLLPMSDASLPIVFPQLRGNYVLGYNYGDHGLKNRLPGSYSMAQLRNYALVSLTDGSRRPVLTDLPVISRRSRQDQPALSPDGRTLLYFDQAGDYVAYDLAAGTARNLTHNLPTRFYLPENKPEYRRQLLDNEYVGAGLMQGWTRDGSTVLLSDYFDVWALNVHDGTAVNLTGDGRRLGIHYNRMLAIRPGQAGPGTVDLAGDIFFKGFNEHTGTFRWIRREPGDRPATVLREEFADINYLRASGTNRWVYSRETSTEPRDYFLVNPDWSPGARLTDLNPQLRDVARPPQAIYLAYKNARGESRHAMLFLPVEFQQGRAHPTIIQIYKGLSHNIHLARTPGGEVFGRQEDGFAMLFPDIVPRVNEAGPAALDDVMAAVNAAIATGAVDRSRLGIEGHSFGAFETCYIVTHTDLFKAAFVYAGPQDFLSGSGAIYGTTLPWSQLVQLDQPYFSGMWWDEWDTYVKNSPIFSVRNLKTPLLLVHGEKDSAVPFAQSLEFFNAAREAGNESVVMLEYKGQEHSLDSEHVLDMSARAETFFAHFLMAKKAPDWWAEGLSRPSGQMPSVEAETVVPAETAN